MQQVVDLQNSKEFQALGVELLSISPDSVAAWADEAASTHITTPLLSDNGNKVANRYGVMQWGMASGEPDTRLCSPARTAGCSGSRTTERPTTVGSCT